MAEMVCFFSAITPGKHGPARPGGQVTGMLEWKAAKPEDKTLLWNIHQKYLYEMTNFYDNEMDA